MLQRRRIILQSPRLAQKKKRRNVIILSFFLAFLVLLCIGFYIFMRLPFLNIQEINVLGTEALIPDEIETKARESLQGSIYFVIPKSNLFFYSKNDLEKSLLEEYPRIKSATLSIESGELNIDIEEKNAFALWCKEECFFMDDTGNIFGKAPEFKGTVYKRYSGLLEGDPIGKSFLDKETLEKIKSAYDVFDSYKVIISKIDMVSPKEARFTSVYDVDFLINLDREIRDTMDNIETILTADRFKDSLPMLRGIEYIDFRFGSKVFFKKN